LNKSAYPFLFFYRSGSAFSVGILSSECMKSGDMEKYVYKTYKSSATGYL